MPIFYYSAKNQAGETKTGTLETKDESSLAQMLRQEGFILTSVKNMETEPAKKKFSVSAVTKSIFGRVSIVEKLMFTRHLAVMIGAGFSLHKGLEVLAQQTENKVFKKIINDIVVRIKKGETLAESMAKYPRVFNNFFVSMVRVGEKGGNLEEVLKNLAQYLKKEHVFISKVRGALTYPAVIVVAMIGIGTLMMVTVVPKITGMFEELNVKLPITTKILIFVTKIISRYFVVAGIILVILIFVAIKFLKTQKGKRAVGWFSLKLPVIKKIIQKMNCARLARSFSSLIESGVPIIESLTITSQTVGNFFYSQSLIDVSVDVKKGKNLQESLNKYKNLYPILVVQMTGVGEQTGELGGIMGRLADFYEEEVSNITENLASIIEPVLMIIIGAAVGFFAVSMIQPMYSMMGTL